MDKFPLVSIVLPVYNADKDELINAVNSVKSQTYKNRELFVINDGSNNWIEKFLKSYDFEDERIMVINNEKNLRLTKTLNRWLSLARWKYIARIDDEDIRIDGKKIEKQIKFLEKYKEYWVCWTNWIAVDEMWKFLFSLNREETDKEIRKTIMQRCPFLHVSVVFRKSCIDELWEYDEKWDYTEDHELWLRLWKKYKLYNIQENCVQFKMDPNWVSWKHKVIQRWNILKLGMLYRKFYPYTIIQLFSNIVNLMISILPLNIIQSLMRIKNNI